MKNINIITEELDRAGNLTATLMNEKNVDRDVIKQAACLTMALKWVLADDDRPFIKFYEEELSNVFKIEKKEVI